MAQIALNLNLNQEAALREALEDLLLKRRNPGSTDTPWACISCTEVEEIMQQLNECWTWTERRKPLVAGSASHLPRHPGLWDKDW